MKVNYRAEINLTLEEIKTLLHHQKNSTNRNKIQVLYWLKNGEVETITKAAKLLGVHRITVQRWWKRYQEGGVDKLLKNQPKRGRPPAIPSEVILGIEKQLNQETEGFKSYKEIQNWVKNKYQLDVKYSTLHNQVYSRMKAKLKVPRPSSIKKDPLESLEFKKNCPN